MQQFETGAEAPITNPVLAYTSAVREEPWEWRTRGVALAAAAMGWIGILELVSSYVSHPSDFLDIFYFTSPDALPMLALNAWRFVGLAVGISALWSLIRGRGNKVLWFSCACFILAGAVWYFFACVHYARLDLGSWLNWLCDDLMFCSPCAMTLLLTWRRHGGISAWRWRAVWILAIALNVAMLPTICLGWIPGLHRQPLAWYWTSVSGIQSLSVQAGYMCILLGLVAAPLLRRRRLLLFTTGVVVVLSIDLWRLLAEAGPPLCRDLGGRNFHKFLEDSYTLEYMTVWVLYPVCLWLAVSHPRVQAWMNQRQASTRQK